MRKIKFTNDARSNKRAEMSLTVVVSAVIALVVLIVLIYIFTNSSTRTSSTFKSCGLNGGECTTSALCVGERFPLNGLEDSCKDNPEGKTVCCSRTLLS